MKPKSRVWGKNTILWVGVVNSGVALLLSFGVHLTADQLAAIVAFSASLGAAIGHQGAESEVKKAEEAANGTDSAGLVSK